MIMSAKNKDIIKFGEDEFFPRINKIECDSHPALEIQSPTFKTKAKRFIKYLFYNIDY